MDSLPCLMLCRSNTCPASSHAVMPLQERQARVLAEARANDLLEHEDEVSNDSSSEPDLITSKSLESCSF